MPPLSVSGPTLPGSAPPERPEAPALPPGEPDSTIPPAVARGGALRHGLWAAGGRFANLFFTAISGIVLGRLLATDDFGRFTVAQTAISLLSLVAAFGVGTAGLRLLGEDSVASQRRGERAILAAVLRVGLVSHLLVGAAVLVLFAMLGGPLLGTPVSLAVAAVMAVCVVLRGVVQVASEVSRGLGDVGTANLLGGANGGPIIGGAFLLLAGSVGWAAGLNWAWAVALYAGAAGLGVLVGAASVLRWKRRQPTIEATHGVTRDSADDVARAHVPHNLTRELTATAWPLMAGMALSFLTTQLDLLLVEYFLAGDAPGLYAAARRVGLLMLIPLGISNMGIMGHIAPLHASGRPEALRRVLGTSAAAAAIPALVLTLPALLMPGTILSVLYGSQYAAAGPILQLLVPGLLATVLTGSTGLVLSLAGGQKSLLISNAIALVVVAASLPLAVRLGGAYGMAIVFSVVFAVQNAAHVWLVIRLTGVSPLCDFPALLRLALPWLRRPN